MEWNDIKWNDEYVRERAEEYLEIYNTAGGKPSAEDAQMLGRQRMGVKRIKTKDLDAEDLERKNKKHVRRIRKLTKEEEEEESIKEELRNLGVDDDDESEDNKPTDDDKSTTEEEDEEDALKKKKTKKIFYGRKKLPNVEPELISDPTNISKIIPNEPLEPLKKRKRQPAQEKVFKELTDINERIASLIQVRQMGLSTNENRSQLKQLIKDRKVKAFELRRLQSKIRASNRYRAKRRKIVSRLISISVPL